MEIVLSSFILGISYGFILFLLGTGLSLTMGLMKIINLAHGAIYMVGAYVGLTVARQTQNFLLGVLAGGIGVRVAGNAHGSRLLAPLIQAQYGSGLTHHRFRLRSCQFRTMDLGAPAAILLCPGGLVALHSHCQLENPRISSGDHRCRHRRRSGFVVLPGKNTDRRNYSRRNG